MDRNRWPRRVRTLVCVLMLVAMMASVGGTAASPYRPQAAPEDYSVTSPRDFFGYDIGQDYKLTPWQTRVLEGEGLRKGIVEYAHELERTSDRVHVFEYGTSEMGRPMILTVITSPDNWAQIDNLKGILRKLADPRQVSSDSEAQLLAEQGKAVYWMTAAIHASERTSPEVLVRLGYHLASGNDAWTTSLLDNVIVVLENTVNPDGLEMVTDWYYKYKGTAYDGSSPPYYNKYINHDNNRDYLGLGMVESQQNAAVRTDWHPTVYHDLHEAMQMLYITPGPDPTNEAIHGITMAEWLGFAGHTMTGLIAKGYKGIYTYDYASMWYPGFMNSYASEYNSYAMFFELQGARGASPRTMTTLGKARAWYNPAPYAVPFTWTLMNAVDLEEDALKLSLDYLLQNKDQMLYSFYLKGKYSLQKTTGESPYAFVIPADGGDNADVVDMVNNLRAHLFEIERASVPFTFGGREFAAGDYIIRTNQPYGLFVKNLLGTQTYPNAKGLNNETLTPFDVTAWTYGLLRDVETVAVTTTVLSSLSTIPVTATVPYSGSLSGAVSTQYAMEHQSNNNLAKVLPQLWQDADMTLYQVDAAFTSDSQTFPAGTFIIKTKGTQADHDKLVAIAEDYGLAIHSLAADPHGVRLYQPKVGLYTPNTNTTVTMPEGWVRMLMDRNAFPYTQLYARDIVSGTLTNYDVIVIPDVTAANLINGSSSATLPPEYRLGMGTAGVANLKRFVELGGTLVMMGRSTAMPIQRGWDVGVTLPATVQEALALEEAQPETEEENVDFPTAKPQARLDASAAYCPGSILTMQVSPTTTVGYGYGSDESVWCDTTGLYFTPASGTKAAIVASYPAEGSLLLSGYLTGEDGMREKAAIVDAPLGLGHVVLLGPNTLYRAQATGTYMFFWNAIIEGSRLPQRIYLPWIPEFEIAGGEK